MRRFLFILFALALASVARAELSVEWIDGNTIRVSGTGYTVVTNNVCTNGLGSCTNCVQISPEQMHIYKTSILSECDSADSDLDGTIYSALEIYERMNQLQQDIATFQRFYDIPNINSSTSAQYVPFTNYVYSVDNSQTILDRDNRPNAGASQAGPRNQWIAYNNGIYDYANTYVLPDATTTKNQAEEIVYQCDDAKSRIDTIRTIVQGMSETACQGCSGGDGGGDGDGSCGDCPCAEQLDAIKDYVNHIDDDFHVQLRGMSAVTNFIPRMDSYAKLVSRILYNDATIVVDDGENSWSNVYLRGESDLYDYDKSNILQRIELLLYGLVSNTSTNWGSATSDVSSDVSDMQDTIDDVKSSVADANVEYTSEVSTISQKVTGLFNALNFFGAGSLGNFAYGEPMQFDIYDFTFDFTNAADFRPLQQVCRTAMQIFYWTAGVVFMLVFWYRVVKFTTSFALRIIHFFNQLLT